MTRTTEADQFASAAALDLRRSEHANDAAAMQLAESIANTLAGRRAAGLSSTVGQSAIVAASKALLTMAEAGAELGRAHALAQRDAKRMGLIYTNLIPTEPKSNDERRPTPTGRQAVA